MVPTLARLARVGRRAFVAQQGRVAPLGPLVRLAPKGRPGLPALKDPLGRPANLLGR